MNLKSKLKYINKTVMGTVLILGLGVTGCKNDDPKPDNNTNGAIVVTVNQPADNQDFNHGDTVWISASIASQHTLHEYLFEINDMTALKRVFIAHGHVHTGPSAHIDTFWVNNVTQSSNMDLIISSSTHEGAAVKDTTRFTCQPL